MIIKFHNFKTLNFSKLLTILISVLVAQILIYLFFQREIKLLSSEAIEALELVSTPVNSRFKNANNMIPPFVGQLYKA